jgi:SagB-type dehydrogenase family enzyme
MYPSGGALYPIETYLIATNIENTPMHALHYNPTTHVLEVLWKLEQEFKMTDVVPGADTIPVSALIVFTAVWERSSAKYGELAYQHALIEAGHMSENVLLVSTALGLETRPMAGYDDDAIARALDLDASYEQVVHTITVCMPQSPQ